MSADEFDPLVERLFARTPALADAELFAAGVEARLASGVRLRTAALGAAGLIGGVIAVRQTVDLNLSLGRDEGTVASQALGRGVEAAGAAVHSVAQSGMQQLGLTNLELGSMGGMQLFWLMAGALIALAAAGLMKLSQEV